MIDKKMYLWNRKNLVATIYKCFWYT